MGTVTQIAGLGVVTAVVAGAFLFRENIKNAFASDEQKEANAKQTDATTDLIKGVGDFGSKITDAIFNNTKDTSKGSVVATDKQKMILGFSNNDLVIIDNETGIIEANTSPKFTLTEKEKTAIRAAQQETLLSAQNIKRTTRFN